MLDTDFVIGLDFDNTLVSYDDAMHQTALEFNFIEENATVQNKQGIRDYIRKLPEGEIKWQKLQAEVYGKRMSQARLMKGAEKFLKICKEHDIKTFIVSHKSKYAAQDKERINLQETALNWMRQNRFFDRTGFGLSEDHVYFEESRREKAFRIKKLGCTHFIDDLQEIFREEPFPQETVPILFSPSNSQHVIEGGKVFRSWKDICNYFFTKPESLLTSKNSLN